MGTTGEDIARLAGCSVSTVSRVLNNVGPVSERTRRAILSAVQENGSIPRVLGPRRPKRAVATAAPSATGLIDIVMVRNGRQAWEAKKQSDGVVIEPASKPAATDFFATQNRYASSYFRHLADGVIEETQRCGYRSTMQMTDYLPGKLMLGGAESHGLIVLGMYCDGVEEFIRNYKQPVVSFIAAAKGDPFDYVGIDNHTGIAAAFEHLRSLGHTKIGYVAGAQASRALRERYAAYRLNLADAGLPFREEWVFVGNCQFLEDQEAAERMLRLPDRPTAILCCYDGAALAVKRAAEVVGLHIPTDLSVVGFDDQDLAELFSPPLTTVRVPAMQMGRHAVQLLMMRIQQPEQSRDPCGLRVTPTLVVRQSTARPVDSTK